MGTGRTKRNKKYSRVFQIAFAEEKKVKNVDLNKYMDFVKEVTSDESNMTSFMHEHMNRLEKESGVKLALLMTGAIGMASEGGEFAEIVKKCIFHCKRELGDIMWYWISSCRALGLEPNEVIAENVKKLEARYPGGAFDVHYSENRKEGDL